MYDEKLTSRKMARKKNAKKKRNETKQNHILVHLYNCIISSVIPICKHNGFALSLRANARAHPMTVKQMKLIKYFDETINSENRATHYQLRAPNSSKRVATICVSCGLACVCVCVRCCAHESRLFRHHAIIIST